MPDVNVLLIAPPHGERDIYLGLLYVAKVLKDMGCRVRLFDPNKFAREDDSGDIVIEVNTSVLDEVVKELDVVGISSFKMCVPVDRKLVSMIRNKVPDVKFMAGGWGPTVYPQLYLLYVGVDLVIRGVHMQALRTLSYLFSTHLEDFLAGNFDELRDVRGLVLKCGNELVSTGLEEVPKPCEIPLIDWDLESYGLDPRDYVERGSVLVPVIGALAPCPRYYVSGCVYCSIAKMIKEYREIYGSDFHEVVRRLTFFDVDRVIKDIENALDYFLALPYVKRISVVLVDDAVTPKNFRKFFDKLLETGLIHDIHIVKFQTRPEYAVEIVKYIPENLRRKFVIDLGVEFFNDSELTFTRRGLTSDELERALEVVSRSGVIWTMYVILASPITSARLLRYNLERILHYIDCCYLVRVNPYLYEEGTELVDVVGEDNIATYVLVSEDETIYEVPYRPRFMTDSKELKKVLEVIREFKEEVLRRLVRYGEELRNEVKRVCDDISRYQELIDEGIADARLVGRVESLKELLEALLLLEEAIKEDIALSEVLREYSRDI